MYSLTEIIPPWLLHTVILDPLSDPSLEARFLSNAKSSFWIGKALDASSFQAISADQSRFLIL